MADPDEVPMPAVVGRCKVCKPTTQEVVAGNVIVSPGGIAHHSDGFDSTACGKNATGDYWWWPL